MHRTLNMMVIGLAMAFLVGFSIYMVFIPEEECLKDFRIFCDRELIGTGIFFKIKPTPEAAIAFEDTIKSFQLEYPVESYEHCFNTESEEKGYQFSIVHLKTAWNLPEFYEQIEQSNYSSAWGNKKFVVRNVKEVKEHRWFYIKMRFFFACFAVFWGLNLSMFLSV